MKNFVVLLQKECFFQWKTKRWLILLLVGAFLGLLASVGELATGLLLELVKKSTPSEADLSPLIAMMDRDPSLLGATQQYFKNFFMISLAVVLVGMNSVSAEIKSGVMSVVMLRPVSRYQIIAAKIGGLFFSASSGLLASAITFLVVCWPTLGGVRLVPFIGMILVLTLFLLVYCTVVVMASAISKNSAMAAGISVAFIILSNLAGSLPALAVFVPEGSFQLAVGIAFGHKSAIFPLWTLAAGLLWAVTLGLLGGWFLQRREV